MYRYQQVNAIIFKTNKINNSTPNFDYASGIVVGSQAKEDAWANQAVLYAEY